MVWVLPSAVLWGYRVEGGWIDDGVDGGKGWSWLRACPRMVAPEQCLVVCRMYLEGCKMSFFSFILFLSLSFSFSFLFFFFNLTISLFLPPDCIRIDCSLSKWFYPFFWLKCICLSHSWFCAVALFCFFLTSHSVTPLSLPISLCPFSCLWISIFFFSNTCHFPSLPSLTCIFLTASFVCLSSPLFQVCDLSHIFLLSISSVTLSLLFLSPI